MKIMLSVSTLVLASVMGAGSAFAADLPETVIVPAPEMVDVSSDWSGAYIGAHVGYASGVVDWETPGPSGDYDISGWLVGAQIGYLHQMDSLVIGVEGTIEWSGVSGEDDFGGGAVSRDINWSGDVTGKLGFAVESILIYGKAGLAYANSTGFAFGEEDTQTHLGWTAGIGIAAKVTDEVSIFAEYDYADYGEQDYDYFDDTTSFTTQAVKFGANWHF